MRSWLKGNWMKFSPILILIVGLFWFFGDNPPKCPEDFLSSEERALAFDKWTKDFYERNLDASIADLAEARNDFYRKHNCSEALRKYEDYMAGRVDKETADTVNGVIDELLYNSTRFDADNLGFRFIHSNEYEVMAYEEDPETIIVFPRKYLEEKPEKINAIIVAARENDPSNSAMDWLNSEYSGYNFAYSYKERKVNGENAYLLRWKNPEDIDGALFLTPDGKRRVTVSILGDVKAMSNEFNKILDAFSFQ